MKKKVLIIGNGFDLDLGWKTRYSDFAGSGCWPFKDEVYPYYLDAFLNQMKEHNITISKSFSDCRVPKHWSVRIARE